MNLRQIRYFLKVAELGNFTRAAEVLNVAQPALSRQIRLLEEDLGEALFIRSGTGVSLTDAGKLLQENATSVVNQFDKLRDVVVDQTAPRGHLTVGLPPALGQFVSLELIDEYCRRYPDVHLHVREGISIDIIGDVQQSKLDCAVVVLDDTPGVEAEYLFKEALFLVAPASAGLSITKPVSLREAENKPLILTNRMNNFRVAIEDAFEQSNIPMRILADSNSTRMISGLVARGTAYSVLPYCAIHGDLRRGEISASPIEHLYVDWAFIRPASGALATPSALFRQLLVDIVRRKIENGTWSSAVLAEIR
ncbi:MAG: LysR family transcriptional regulator [Cryobacterium sp.]|nr:LysR family transcriptional regulator [Cryobacterium sp.]MBX3521160.1 LysR family transcriptional regulator [Xanthobacteraceae bacterium]MBX3549027.1 LysR family transcriptional regulator [Xanthobacteraceae bacterium]MCW5675420.1 LysR family transcriptional regulator [Xanthobacteraceae bacterium]MCW5676568.1 LysR family transcriptional regulator [Xanthobacteraceae bacterium]